MNLNELKTAAEMGQLFGLYEGIKSDDYHHRESPGVSSTFLKNILSSTPMHALASLDEPKDTDALVFGRAFHTALEDDSAFYKNYCAVPPGMRRDKRNAEYQSFLAENSERTVLTVEDFETIQMMRNSVVSHPLFPLTRGGKIEHSGYWTDESTGVLCKIRPDVLREDGLVFDWKSSAKPINPYSFSKTVHDFGYNISGAFYLEGLSKILGQPLRHFVLVAVEKFKPYACVFYEIDHSAIEKGLEDVRHALTVYAHCKSTGEWPGYPTGFELINLPHYAYSLNA